MGDSQILDTFYIDPNDLLIVLKKDKRSCPSKYRYHISQYVLFEHISMQYQNFISDIDYVRSLPHVEEALEYKSWVQAMSEEMKKKEDIWEIIERRGGKKPVGC